MNLGNATLKSVTRECAPPPRAEMECEGASRYDGPLIAYVGEIGSRPEILRGVSKQSVTASDDYHSASDYASSSSSSVSDGPTTAVRWQTPPSQARSPASSAPDHVQSEASIPGRAGGRRERMVQPRSAITEVDEARLSGPPLASLPGSGSGGRATASDVSPPTPGVDDTPYIRYAIEQITRNDVEAPPARRPATASSVSTYPVERIIPLAVVDPPRPREENPRPPVQEEAPRSDLNNQLYIPVDRPQNRTRFPDLTFRPAVLGLLSLGLLTLLCLLMIAALIFCAIFSGGNDGLWNYVDADGGRFFVFTFLPQMLAALILLYVFAVTTALMRIVPFMLLALGKLKARSQAPLLDLRPRNYFLPQLSYFRAGQPLIGICMIIFWLSIFTIPLQSALFQVRLFGRGSGAIWRWVTVEPVAWTLVALYALLALATAILAGFLARRRTGLKWDPVSLADLMVLVQQSNTLGQFEGSETFSSKRQIRQRLASGSGRLGYWKLAEEPGRVFYAVGEEGAPTRRYSLQQGRIQPQLDDVEDEKREEVDFEAQRLQPETSEGKRLARIRSPMVRYRFIPWFLRDSAVVAWIVMALVFLVAFLIVSFLRRGVERGFRPLLDAIPDMVGFSAPGFLYSFVPSIIGMILFLFWRGIDMEFRALQAFAELAEPDGVSAERSLLLDYPSCLLGEVTVKAAAARHWKVAWISFVSLLSITLPIIGGGVFWALYFPDEREVRMVAHMPAFKALIVFFTIYCLSLLVVWPRRKRYLPHDSRSLAELVSFFYRSSLLRGGAFHEPTSKTDLVTRLLSVPHGHDKPMRYYFGVYRSVDGKEHLGIDGISS